MTVISDRVPTPVAANRCAHHLVGLTSGRGADTVGEHLASRQRRSATSIAVDAPADRQQMYFLEQLTDEPVCNELHVATITGHINAAALKSAVKAVTRRHEVLRTTFHLASDGALQRRVLAEPAVEFAYLDLSHVRSGADVVNAWSHTRLRADLVDAVIEAAAAKPFDLSAGLLHRWQLISVADDHHVLVASMHHMIIDGWSLGIVMRDVQSAYGDILRAAEPQFDHAPLQYADHLGPVGKDGAAHAAHARYWQAQLAGDPTGNGGHRS